MKRNSLWSHSIAAGLLAISMQPCLGQWYQGPSGGLGGSPFDHWKLSNSSTNITRISFRITNGSLHCIYVVYGTGPSTRRVHAGDCDLGPDPAFRFGEVQGLDLAADEYIIGISGKWDDHINSIRVYTNKRTSPTFGSAGGRQEFGYTAPQGQMIVGFFGRAGDNLDAIGVLYAPCSPEKKPCR